MYSAFSYVNLPQRLTSQFISTLYCGQHEFFILLEHLKEKIANFRKTKISRKEAGLILIAVATLIGSSLGSSTSLGQAAETSASLILNGLSLIANSLEELDIAPDLANYILEWVDAPSKYLSNLFTLAIWLLMGSNFYMQLMNNKPKLFNLIHDINKVETEENLISNIEKTLNILNEELIESVGIDNLRIGSFLNENKPTDLETKLRFLIKQLRSDTEKLNAYKKNMGIQLNEYDTLNSKFIDMQERVNQLLEIIAAVSKTSQQSSYFNKNFYENLDKFLLVLLDWIPAVCSIVFFSIVASLSTLDRTVGMFPSLFFPVIAMGWVAISTAILQGGYFHDNLRARAASKQINFLKKHTFFSLLFGAQSFVSNFLGETTLSLSLLMSFFSKKTSLVIFAPMSIFLSFISTKSGVLTFRKVRIYLNSRGNKPVDDTMLLLLPTSFKVDTINTIDDPSLFVIQKIPGTADDGLLYERVKILWMANKKMQTHECNLPSQLENEFKSDTVTIVKDKILINEIRQICKKAIESKLLMVGKKATKTVENVAIVGKAFINMGNFFGSIAGVLFHFFPSPSFFSLVIIALLALLFAFIALVSTVIITTARNSTVLSVNPDTKIRLTEENAEEIIVNMQKEKPQATYKSLMCLPPLSYLSTFSIFAMENQYTSSAISIPDGDKYSGFEVVPM